MDSPRRARDPQQGRNGHVRLADPPPERRIGSTAIPDRVVVAGLAVAVVAVLVQTAAHLGNAAFLDNRFTLLSADAEGTPFSWASTVACFAAAFAVLLAAAAFPALAPRLLLLAAILAFFSLDDAVGLHERLGAEVLSPLLGLPAYTSRLLWPAVYVPLLLLAVALLWRLAREGPTRARHSVRLGVALLAGAVAAEAASTLLFRLGVTHGDRIDFFEVALEEGVELAGWIFVAAGLTSCALHTLGLSAAELAHRERRQAPAPVAPGPQPAVERVRVLT